MFSSYTTYPKLIKSDMRKFYSFYGLMPTHLETRLNQFNFAEHKDKIEFNQKSGETRIVRVEHSIVLPNGDTFKYTLSERQPIKFTTHLEETLEIDGLEAIQLSAKQPSKKYKIRFASDTEYGLNRTLMLSIATDLKVNYLFWNYPNEGKSQGHVRTIDDYVDAGIKIVDAFKKQSIPPEEVTLYGKEFGGHIASAVAYHFHQQKYPIRVHVNQMSSTLFSDLMSRGEEEENARMPTFLTHCMLMAKGGSLGLAALGFILGNFINTLGVLLAALTYYFGQGLTHGFRFLRLELLANGIEAMMTSLSYLIYEFFNGLGSLTTLIVSVPLVLAFNLSFLHAILAIGTWALAFFGYNLAKTFSEFGTNALGFATHMHIPSKKLLSTLFAQNPHSIIVNDSPEIESKLTYT